jgi:ATP-dependent exoDNAse (exonuclease V) beta subunit
MDRDLSLFKSYQEKILDLDASIFISASAGGGKTTLVVKRFLKLLLISIIDSGKLFHVEQFKILILTYTNEAVSEIKNRVASKLETWGKDLEHLKLDLKYFFPSVKLEQSKISHIRSSCLNLILSSQYLKFRIQTFHSFCFDILRNFNLIGNRCSIVDKLEKDRILDLIKLRLKNKIVPRGTFSGKYENRKINLLNCSTWNNFMKQKLEIRKNKLKKSNFLFKKDNTSNERPKLFHVEQFFAKQNIEKVNLLNCSTWNNLPSQKINLLNCSTWNNFRVKKHQILKLLRVPIKKTNSSKL